MKRWTGWSIELRGCAKGWPIWLQFVESFTPQTAHRSGWGRFKGCGKRSWVVWNFSSCGAGFPSCWDGGGSEEYGPIAMICDAPGVPSDSLELSINLSVHDELKALQCLGLSYEPIPLDWTR